ncbi:hypothetical protein ACFYPZ_19545 [Streptomyces sp. NPDC005506]|uniref:hypothetical protein n=1 Tax=Streptomyces sp. NPDC005506 TaxID=3364718 RepID=UPI0036C0E28B
MNGFEHYLLAEKLAADVANGSGYDLSETAALAQVHATLALAAATADATGFRKNLYAGNGEEFPDTTKAREDAKNARLADAALAFLD